MDALASIGTSGLQAPDGANGFGALTSGQFVKLIFTELSRQDPLKPNDSSALLQQMAQIRSIQSDIDLSGKLEALVSENQFSSAATLIGRRVEGISDENERIRGEVASVSRSEYGAVLVLRDGRRLLMSNVDQLFPAGTTGTANGAGASE